MLNPGNNVLLYDEVSSYVVLFLCQTSFLYQRPPLQSFKCNDKWNSLNIKYVNFKGDLKKKKVRGGRG